MPSSPDTDRNDAGKLPGRISRRPGRDDGSSPTPDATPAARKRSCALGKQTGPFGRQESRPREIDKKSGGHGIRRNHFRFQRNAVLRLRQARAGMAYRIATTAQERLHPGEMHEQVHGRSSRSIFEYLLRKPLPQEQVRELIERKETIYRELCLRDGKRFRLAPGAAELPDWLCEHGIPAYDRDGFGNTQCTVLQGAFRVGPLVRSEANRLRRRHVSRQAGAGYLPPGRRTDRVVPFPVYRGRGRPFGHRSVTESRRRHNRRCHLDDGPRDSRPDRRRGHRDRPLRPTRPGPVRTASAGISPRPESSATVGKIPLRSLACLPRFHYLADKPA